MMSKRIFAVHCHPDDIEFMMSGTLFLLGEAGCELHYMNIANGSCGTAEHDIEKIVSIRGGEAKAAAGFLGAEHHESITGDLEVFYSQDLIRKVCAVIREIRPDIMLVPSPEDYMEDHMNAGRIAVTAAFCRGMRNYTSVPEVPPVFHEVVIYHAQPYGLCDMLRRPVYAELYTDVSSVIDKKEKMLSFHKSQKEWLDKSQGLDAYLITMEEMTRDMGTLSGRYEYAEGWRRHSHLGFCSSPGYDPLRELLGGQLSCLAGDTEL
jgi:N-acetylglucosamine malate deacetylase 1